MDMIFPVDALLASLSRGMTLEPGDIIATGTPGGAAPPAHLQRSCARVTSWRARSKGSGRRATRS
ncbi:MAG: fumarylacetoacetate hydrolase family protein [Vicinamibacterales bacterium]